MKKFNLQDQDWRKQEPWYKPAEDVLGMGRP
jgi:hypothetical protein